MKAKDDNDVLKRGWSNLIKQGLGEEYQPVTDVAEARMILNTNTIPHKETLLRFLQNEQDSINPDIREDIISGLIDWLKCTTVTKD